MEDFIYILLGIAWIGFTIYNQQKKLKQKQERAAQKSKPSGVSEAHAYEPPPEKEKSFLEKLMEEISDEPVEDPIQRHFTEDEPQQTYQGFNKAESVERAKSVGDIIENNSALSKEYFKRTEKNDIKDQEEEEEFTYYEPENYVEYLADFDLRKAVIYSAILERPYH